MGPGLKVQHRRLSAEGRPHSLELWTLVVEGETDRLGARHVEEIQQRRKTRILYQDPITHPDQVGREAIERVERTAHHGYLLGNKRPTLPEDGFKLGQHRTLDVTCRVPLGADLAQGTTEVGQQGRIGYPRGQVESQATGALVRT